MRESYLAARRPLATVLEPAFANESLDEIRELIWNTRPLVMHHFRHDLERMKPTPRVQSGHNLPNEDSKGVHIALFVHVRISEDLRSRVRSRSEHVAHIQIRSRFHHGDAEIRDLHLPFTVQ